MHPPQLLLGRLVVLIKKESVELISFIYVKVVEYPK